LLGGGDLEVGVVHLVVVLDRLLKATTIKKVANFFEEKSAPPQKNPGYAYGVKLKCICVRVLLQ